MKVSINIPENFSAVIKEIPVEDAGAFLKYLSSCAFDDNAVNCGLVPEDWPLAWALFLVAKDQTIIVEDEE